MQWILYCAPGELNECPACESAALFELDVLTLRRGRTGFVSGCDGCGLVFSNPLPTPEDLARFYSPSGAWGSDRGDVADDPAREAASVGGRWAQMFDPIRTELDVTSPSPGSRVLDFGCGEGKLLDVLQKCGWETFGIEPAFDAAFRRHVRLEAVPEDPTFDLIVLMQVLEHVTRPLELLRQLAGACRIGGHLLVSVPRLDTLPVHRDYRYVLNGHVHITAYTWVCLRTLLARAGWEAVAPPPDEISKGGGRRTASRLRVLARRVEGPVREVDVPGDDARSAVRAYYADGDSRPLLARAGLLRLAARQTHINWERAKVARKALKQDVISGAEGL